MYIYIYKRYIHTITYIHAKFISPWASLQQISVKARDTVAAAHGAASSDSMEFGGADGGDHRRVAPRRFRADGVGALELEMPMLDGEMMMKRW